MDIPTTYAQWSACLDRFEAGDCDGDMLAVMRAGTLSWQGGVAPLFARRISETIDMRLKRVADSLSRSLRLGADATSLSRALLDARQKLATTHRLASLPAFPEELRKSLEGFVQQYAQTTQQSLEDSAKRDHSGQIANIVRQNTLLRYTVVATADANIRLTGNSDPAAASPSSSSAVAGTPARRRNILA
ncbi:MAG: hypothetical protein FWD62_03785 [Betaproteobacteria bacterium]|nr:hypothetical protein [Betaproteobacteria bacterium]